MIPTAPARPVPWVLGGKLGYFESLNAGQNWGASSDDAFASIDAINASACALALVPSVKQTIAGVAGHIIYFDLTLGKHRYVANHTETGKWSPPQDITTGSLPTGSYSGFSIAVGSDGLPRVAFLDCGTKSLQCAERSATG